MRYVSPFDERARPLHPLAPRPATLAGARVALLDIGKARGAELLDRLEEHLAAAGARCSRHAKPFFSRPAALALVERIAAEADVAVEALAD